MLQLPEFTILKFQHSSAGPTDKLNNITFLAGSHDVYFAGDVYNCSMSTCYNFKANGSFMITISEEQLAIFSFQLMLMQTDSITTLLETL